MIARVWWLVMLELRSAWRRPLWWVLLVVVFFLTWGFSSGSVRIGTGGSTANAERAWLNSQFNLAFGDILVCTLFYAFFIAVAFGSAITDDEEQRTGPILHGTKLSVPEYVLGRFLGVAAVASVVMGLHLLLQMIFYENYPVAEPDKVRAPLFVAWNYARPFLWFVALPVMCLGAFTFAVGALTRQAILVFLVPIVLLVGCAFFLWNWSPEWLGAAGNKALQVIDPTGFRWLNETWIKDDRGARFYNTTSVPLDQVIGLNRAWMLALAVGSLGATVVVERRRLRHPYRVTAADAAAAIAAQDALDVAAAAGARPTLDPGLRALGMSQRKPAWLQTFTAQLRAEARELRRSPGLWIFVPLITIEAVGDAFFSPGPFDTPTLITSGTLAQQSFDTITLLSLFLLLFYATESMSRDDRRRISGIVSSTPATNSARLLGKLFANVAVVLTATLVAIYAAVVISMAIQWFMAGGGQGLPLPTPWPLLQVWGLFLLPTVAVWMGLVALMWTVTRNRYAVYGAGLGVLLVTGILFERGWINWVGNWHLWDAVRWTDFGSFELDRSALILNRVSWVLAAALMVQLALMVNRRRTPDPQGIATRLRPKVLLRGALKLLPLTVATAVCMVTLAVEVRSGPNGGPADRAAKAYRAANAETWRDHKGPAISQLDLDLTLDPAQHSFAVKGTYVLTNPTDEPIDRFALTPGWHYKDIVFTFRGSDHTAESTAEARRKSRNLLPVENSAGLWVFRPENALKKGDTVEVGFAYHGVYPPSPGFNSRGAGEFILPAGVVLNAFSNSFLPMVGWVDGIGVDPEDTAEPRRHERDDWKKLTKPGLGTGGAMHANVRVSLPEEYRANAPGCLESDTVVDGTRAMVWRTDHPVRFFNVVAGRLVEAKGELTSIWHLPQHTSNIAAMIRALDGSRRWYSEWFHPYPWKDLRLTEFAGLASYAQGFATNIVFSESIGFLSKPTDEQDAPFLITAHEAAHQWWGNILMPGDGPGGNILSEGLAHYSTARLMEKMGCDRTGSDKPMNGEQARQAFLRGIEKSYVEARRPDEERPMVEIDGMRPGDTAVTYDKGGWVFWMLKDLMGEKASDEGMRDFIAQFKDGPDYPLLQDFVQVMRQHAPDQVAFDAFVDQWFFDVVLPEFKIEDAQTQPGEGETWVTTATIRNAGTGTVSVTVAAVNSNDRWDAKSGAENAEGAGSAPEYADARQTVTLTADGTARVEIVTAWKPLKLVVDPDARQLQMGRKNAERSLER